MGKQLGNAVTFGLIVIAAVVIVRLVMSPGVAPTPASLDGAERLEQAMTRAQDEGKVVFAVATASWCGPCQTYKRNALADTQVQSWINNNAVGIMIDVDKNRVDTDRLGVRAMPTTFIIKDGTVVNQFEGVAGANQLLAMLEPYTRQ